MHYNYNNKAITIVKYQIRPNTWIKPNKTIELRNNHENQLDHNFEFHASVLQCFVIWLGSNEWLTINIIEYFL